MKSESEKLLEQKLKKAVESLGGLSIKLLPSILGLPDRICLLPGGGLFFAEIKTTNKKPTKLQEHTHKKLRSLGFIVYVIDNSKQINLILQKWKH